MHLTRPALEVMSPKLSSESLIGPLIHLPENCEAEQEALQIQANLQETILAQRRFAAVGWWSTAG